MVIGSGATAATLVPAMAEDCAAITMLQRSPTYFFPAANRAEIADMLRELEIPEEWVHEITRRKILSESRTITRRSFEDSEALRAELIAGARAYLGEDFDVETHFTPSYRPWRQRLALLPDGDLFRAIKAGQASVVTDQHRGPSRKAGSCCSRAGSWRRTSSSPPPDWTSACWAISTSSSTAGPLKLADCWGHRGILFSGVPNMAWVFGYLRASWTLRADLVSQFVCRLLNHMAEKGAEVVTPAAARGGPGHAGPALDRP